MAKNYIELNGKRYDTLTGRILPSTGMVRAGGTDIVRPVVAHAGTTIDGVRKPASHRTHPAAAPARHKTERSKTLMRHAVKKPAPIKVRHQPHAPAVQHHSTPRLDIAPGRAARAQHVPKSHLVSKFGLHSGVKTHTTVLPVQPPPVIDHEPPLTQHKPSPAEAHAPHHDAFQKAIHEATSHTQPHHEKQTKRQRASRRLRVSTRAVNATAVSIIVILLAGFFTYQNVPNLSMRLASARSGVDGQMPSYKPSGFSLRGPIQYESGQITMHYGSNSDNRNFQITQKASDWNSTSLLENFVASNQRPYQTYQENGKTIYIYEDDNATWVDAGVWYQIEGDSSLNSDQLIRLAASM